MLPVSSVALLVVIMASIMAAESKLEDAYLVHVRNEAMPSDPGMPLASWHASLLSDALLLNNTSFSPKRILLYSYRVSFPGFAALLTPSQASRLSASDAVIALHKNGVARSHTTRTPAFLGLSSSISPQSSTPGPLWSASSQGLNTVIGLLDSGIWPHHPSFDDSGLDPVTDHRIWTGVCENNFPCNRKIIGARYYFKGYEAYTGHPINDTLEFKSPFDNNGHGTHTSGTAAGSFVANASFFGLASGTASGIAPLARISVYKVCWEMGEACTFADILAAFDDAISDGVDVISVSIGGESSTNYSIDTIAIGAFASVARGILVACSAGNFGPQLGSVTNGAPWILTVAASTLDRDFPAPVTLGDGAVYEGTSLYVGDNINVTQSELKPLIYARDAAAAGVDPTNASLCVSTDYLNRTEVTGKLVLCEDGTVTPVEKGLAVTDAGGVGVIVSNPSIYGEMLQSSPNIAPGTQIGFAEGKAILQYIDGSGDPTSTPEARIDFHGTRIGGRAPAMAAFSSRGPHLSSISVLKPDVTAPGLNVLAAWTAVNSPSELDQDTRRVVFNIISGTSMSCPHLAGLGALLKAAHPTWSPAAIRSALMTTATVLDNTGEPIVDSATTAAADPLAYGSGHVRPNRALDPGLVYDIQVQGYVDFLCALDSSLLEIYKGSNSYTCNNPLPHIGDLNYPSFSVAFHQSAHNSSNPFSATFSRSVTNVGPPKSTYVVSITPPEFVTISVSPSTLTFDSDHPILSYSITFVASVLPSLPQGDYHLSFGSLSWMDAYGHIVHSPISFIWY